VPAGTQNPANDVNIQIADRNGLPVSVSASHITITNTSSTAANYTVTGLNPGQYYVYFSDTTAGDNVAPDYYGDGGVDNIIKATLVTVPATGGMQSLSAVTLVSGATVTGTVTDGNSAAETHAHVTALAGTATSVADPMLSGLTTSVSSGKYTISGLPAGRFSLAYDATGASFGLSGVYVNGAGVTYDNGSATQFGPLGPGTTTTASFSVPAVGTISGTVTDSSNHPLAGVNVRVYDAMGKAIPPAASTAFDGSYSVVDVLPGIYEVQFAGLAGSNLAATYYGGSSLATATKLTVSSGATTAGISGMLGVGATISGTVTAAQGGAPLGGLPVDAVDAQGKVIVQTTTNPDGTYTLTNVPAGTWYLKFVGGRAFNGQYYATEYYLGQSTLGGSLAIKLTPGEALGNLNQALLLESTTLPGLPKVSLGHISGLASGKVALSFRLSAGAGPAGYLSGFSIKLPKFVSWNRSALKRDIVIPGDKFTYTIKAGRLVVNLQRGVKLVNFRIKAGGVKVGKGLQLQAKARKIKSEGIALAVSDTTGKLSAASFTVKKPH
jgi:hypothetical protein